MIRMNYEQRKMLEISEKEPKALASSSKHNREWNQLVTSQAIQ